MKSIPSIDHMTTDRYYMLYGHIHRINGEIGKCASICRKLNSKYEHIYDGTTSKISEYDSFGRAPRRCRLLEDFTDIETGFAFIHTRYTLDVIFELDEVEVLMLEDAFLL